MASSCRLGNVLAAFAGAGRAAQSSAAHSSTGVLPLRRPLRRAMSSAQGGSVFSDMEAWKAGRSDPAKRKARLRPTTEVEAEVAAQRADERERRMAHATGGKVEAEEAPGSARVFVYNMPYSWDEETMRRRVRRAAKVKAVQVLRGRDGRSKGAGLVEFADGVDPHVAAQRLDGLRSGGRTLGAKVDTQRLYYVALEGLHQQVRWFDVKDLMRVFGRVDHVYFDARSTAIATFRYHKPAVEAICTLNNSPIFGRNITARAHVGDDGVEADWFEELTDKARVARSVLVSGVSCWLVHWALLYFPANPVVLVCDTRFLALVCPSFLRTSTRAMCVRCSMLWLTRPEWSGSRRTLLSCGSKRAGRRATR